MENKVSVIKSQTEASKASLAPSELSLISSQFTPDLEEYHSALFSGLRLKIRSNVSLTGDKRPVWFSRDWIFSRSWQNVMRWLKAKRHVFLEFFFKITLNQRESRAKNDWWWQRCKCKSLLGFVTQLNNFYLSKLWVPPYFVGNVSMNG